LQNPEIKTLNTSTRKYIRNEGEALKDLGSRHRICKRKTWKE